jgi:hypothetical protein
VTYGTGGEAISSASKTASRFDRSITPDARLFEYGIIRRNLAPDIIKNFLRKTHNNLLRVDKFSR